MPPSDAWTRPTTHAWQWIDDDPIDVAGPRDRLGAGPPFRYEYPARLCDGRTLRLPIRRLVEPPDEAVASLIANQASIDVVASLAQLMGELARPADAQVVVGLPTLGMAFAPGVASALRHSRWVPLGYSRKFWYDETLSTTVSSFTSPGSTKRIYIDPNQLPLVSGRRVLIVDDVVSSARTLAAVWDLLERLGCRIAATVVAMRQGTHWIDALGPQRAPLVLGACDSPRFRLGDDGWWPIANPLSTSTHPEALDR